MTAPEDPARWTVDDDVIGGLIAQTEPHHSDGIVRSGATTCLACGDRWPCLSIELATALRDLRVQHEGCTHATDTLRRAREIAAEAVNPRVPSVERAKASGELILLLTHPLLAEESS